MKKAILFNFNVDKENKLIKVERSFDAPLDLVWSAWTEADILDLWWAPKPYQNETKKMDFREGGRWHYCMLSPEGQRHYCLFDYEKIVPHQMYAGKDAFCDENEVKTDTPPGMHWTNSFKVQEEGTVVSCDIRFEKLEDLEAIIQMGFKEGFTMGLGNLDDYISTQFYLRKDKKPNNKARVSSYVNFPGNTEDAFNFYKGIFKTDFVNGIQRFGEIPSDPNMPPMSEEVKRMIIHVELPLVGGHILMGTDAPKEMGFTLNQGNNMHISLEPDSREETERIFNGLSTGGNITMPLQDMFWGAYYGSCTDKYGINWMVNFQQV